MVRHSVFMAMMWLPQPGSARVQQALVGSAGLALSAAAEDSCRAHPGFSRVTDKGDCFGGGLYLGVKMGCVGVPRKIPSRYIEKAKQTKQESLRRTVLTCRSLPPTLWSAIVVGEGVAFLGSCCRSMPTDIPALWTQEGDENTLTVAVVHICLKRKPAMYSGICVKMTGRLFAGQVTENLTSWLSNQPVSQGGPGGARTGAAP